ncbi:MAG: response regulator transcription factor [Synechococcales bacterium]|nr:response regulator transcription factor [Cyanobacteria bacterium REEB444]MEB3125510.1 response regulator transcription factor [Synechococcales bacterium]
MALLILVVEDDPGTQLAISDYLQLKGYDVLKAASGEMALTLVEEYQPHLVITDVMMPLMDGYELVRRLRQRPILRLLPVIFLTARHQTDDRIQAYKLGCDAFLSKPFELKEIGAVVQNLLERSLLIQSEWLLRSRIPPPPSPGGMPPGHDIGNCSDSPPVDISSREEQVLQLLLNGLSNGQIGMHLYLSSRTVEKYVSSLFRKTNTNNRAELVRFALEHRIGISHSGGE